MKAIILAAGYGTRMLPLTQQCPKALLSLHSKPLLQHVIDLLPEINGLVVNAHYLSDQLVTYFKKNTFPFPVNLSLEQEIKGTGGGLFQAIDHLLGEDFILINCDILCRLDYSSLSAYALKSQADILLLTQDKDEESKLLFDKHSNFAGHKSSKRNRTVDSIQRELEDKAYCGIAYFTKAGGEKFKLHQCDDFSIIDSFFKLAEKGVCIKNFDIGEIPCVDVGNIEQLEAWQATSLPF